MDERTRDPDASWIPYSRVYLPQVESPPKRLLDFFIERFPRIPSVVWQQRFRDGLITDTHGIALGENDPFVAGQTILYRKHVEEEPVTAEPSRIVFQDERILVADKPHGAPVTPSGDYVLRSVLCDLQRRLQRATLTPVHRLDRDTAGLTLFSVDLETRALYHRLFAQSLVHREYVAVAPAGRYGVGERWRVENRIERGDPWFTQAIVPGRINAITEIELLEVRGTLGLFRLRPATGKKHQLRIHMASLHCPIAGDPLYSDRTHPDPAPLQLLARVLGFADPVTGERREFCSTRTLSMWP